MVRKKGKEKKVVNETNSENEKLSNAGSDAENVTETEVKVEIDEPDQDKSDNEEEPKLTEEEKLAKRVAELEDKLLRSAAEFDNYKKRMARNYDEMIRSAGDKILIELLDIVDNFERALNTEENTDLDAFREGTKLIFNQMKGLLEKYNIKPIEALGKPFDPNLHEALMQVASDEYDEGVVALEIGKGYCRDKRVLRHSKVGVSTGKAKEEDKE